MAELGTVLSECRSSTKHSISKEGGRAQVTDRSVRSFRSVSGSVVLMDELDQLFTAKQDVVYNFFNWPTIPGSQLVVIAVANTMDMPEKLAGRVKSRMGESLLFVVSSLRFLLSPPSLLESSITDSRSVESLAHRNGTNQLPSLHQGSTRRDRSVPSHPSPVAGRSSREAFPSGHREGSSHAGCC